MRTSTSWARGCLDQRGHVRIEGRKDLRRELEEGDVETAVAERLDGLETDEAGTDHDGRRGAGVEQGAEGVGVRDVAKVRTSGRSSPGRGGTIGSAPVARTRSS